jgi:two-component system chemotaxis response regulator CheB
MVLSDDIKVLVVDDSAMMRRMVKQVLDTDPQINVVGMARDGVEAIAKDRDLNPDVITMDINMPAMDGLTAMLHVFEQHPEVSVVVLSSLTQEGALTTFEALELGAFDYVAKPSGTVSSNLYIVGKELITKVKAAFCHGQKARRRAALRGKRVLQDAQNAPPSKRLSPPARPEPLSPSRVSATVPASSEAARIAVIIGVSTGGPGTLMEIIPKLPRDLNASVIVVQHMPPGFTASFARRLDEYSQLSFTEAAAGDKLHKGHGFVAPGGIHFTVRANSLRNEAVVRLTSMPKDTLFTPSVNVTMNSVLEFFGERTVGVLLTGMGDDGADGMVSVKKAGGITIAEHESTAVVYGMPREAIERGGASIIAPAHQIADEITRSVRRLS